MPDVYQSFKNSTAVTASASTALFSGLAALASMGQNSYMSGTMTTVAIVGVVGTVISSTLSSENYRPSIRGKIMGGITGAFTGAVITALAAGGAVIADEESRTSTSFSNREPTEYNITLN